VQGTLLAATISPDNTPHGYNLTFAFPMLMFIIIATALYLRFRSPHRVPGSVAFTSARTGVGAATAEAGDDGTTPGSTLLEDPAQPGGMLEGAAPEGAAPESSAARGATAEGAGAEGAERPTTEDG
jgi:hypothetical protein